MNKERHFFSTKAPLFQDETPVCSGFHSHSIELSAEGQNKSQKQAFVNVYVHSFGTTLI